MPENQRTTAPSTPHADTNGYPKSPIEQTITERLLGDVARTQTDTQSSTIKLKDRFETYGSPAANAVMDFLGKQEVALDEAQNTKENQPVESRWWSITRKIAANVGSFALGYGLGWAGGPIAAILGRIGLSGIRSAVEYKQNATLEKASQFYKHRRSSLENPNGFLEKSRKLLASGERVGLEKAFKVKDRDNEIFAKLDTLSGTPGAIRVNDAGLENPKDAYAKFKKITGADLEADKPEAAQGLKNTSELLKLLYTQSILAGYSQNVSPEKVQAYADMVVLLSTAYNESLKKHRQLASTNNLESLQDIWKSAQESTTQILKSGILTYTTFSTLGAAAKSAVFAGIGMFTREMVDAVRDSAGLAQEVISPPEGPTHFSKSLIDNIDQRGASTELDSISVTGFHSRAEELLTAGGESYDNILDVDERAYRLQFIEAIHMAKNPDIGQEHIEMLHTLENKGVSVDQIFRAVDNGKIPEEWGVDINTARSILSASRYESLIEQMASITGKSSAEVIKMLAEGDMLAKLDAVAAANGTTTSELIKALTIRGDVVGGRDGISILARIMTDSTTSGDIASLQQMMSYTGGVSKAWFNLTQEVLDNNISAVSNSAEVVAADPTLTSLEDMGNANSYVYQFVSENEIYADLQGNHIHKDFTEDFSIFFEERFPGQDLDKYLNDLSVDPYGERLERLEFLEAIDLAKDENSSRFYMQTLENITKEYSLTHAQIIDLVQSGKAPIAEWGITQEQVETLPAAIRLNDLVSAMAQTSGNSTSQVIDDLAGVRLNKAIEEFATNNSLNADVVKQIIMMHSGFNEGEWTGDNLLVKIYAGKVQESDINIFKNPKTIEGLNGIDLLWKNYANKVFNQDGDEMATIQQLGYKSMEEYYTTNGLDLIDSGMREEGTSSLTATMYAIRSALLDALGYGSGIAPSIVGAVLATGNYPQGKYAKTSTNANSSSQSQQLNTNNSNSNNSENINDGEKTFGSYHAHIRYRITIDSKYSNARLVTSDGVREILTKKTNTSGIKETPSLLSLMMFVEKDLPNDSPYKKDLLNAFKSEVGALRSLRFVALYYKLQGKVETGDKILEWRDNLLTHDNSISTHTKQKLEEENSIARANSINQVNAISDLEIKNFILINNMLKGKDFTGIPINQVLDLAGKNKYILHT